MEVLDIIKKRRSIRFYKRQAVTEDNVKKLIEAARWAPSGHRLYARRIVVVQREEIIRHIKAASPGLHDIPATLLILCRDKKREEEAVRDFKPLKKEEEKFLEKLPMSFLKEAIEHPSVMDVAISAQNICLEATALGIGSCIIGMFERIEVRQILGLNKNIVPHLLVSLGYPDKQANVVYSRSVPQPPMKRSIKDTVIGWIK